MKITPIGVDVNRDTIINETFKTPQSRNHAKICEETNFETGHIAFEDAMFLPEGTYVVLKENGKKDRVGRIFHYNEDFHADSGGVAIVDVNYDMTASKKRLLIKDEYVIAFSKKRLYGRNRNEGKYLQVVSYEHDENDNWEFVRIEYGNPNVKMFYKYAWKYWNGKLFEKKDAFSKQVEIPFCNAKYAYKDSYDETKITNVEYKIPPKKGLLPGELELILLYIILLAVTFIFEGRWMLWTIFTIGFFIIRKNIRSKYNG